MRRPAPLLPLLLLAACSSPAPAPPAPTAPALTATDQSYLAQVRANTTLDAVPDQQLVALGDKVCGNLNTQRSIPAATSALRTVTGWSSTDAAYVTGSAIRFYCPSLASLAH